MPQVSLYLNDKALDYLHAEAKKEERSLSSFVSKLIIERAERASWPRGYWDEVYGCLEDSSFQVPPEIDASADGPLPSFT